MAYADDLVCFLIALSDLNRLQYQLQRYSSASNAKVNLHKTQILSLSGKPISSLIWRDLLTRHHLLQRYNCHTLEPLVYLGYPLYTSLNQRYDYQSTLLSKIETACSIHHQRSLSIRGRAIILNSLILSRLWHILRVVRFLVAFIDRIKSAMYKFLGFRAFPFVSLQTLYQVHRFGGLSVLNPLVQQYSLQLRWLNPLLESSLGPTGSPTDASFIIQHLIHYLRHHVVQALASSNAPSWIRQDYLMALLFPLLRPSTLASDYGIFSLIFRCIDNFPYSFSHMVVSASTYLSLPLASVIISSSSVPLSRALQRLPVSTAYCYDSSLPTDQLRLEPIFIQAMLSPAFATLGAHPFLSADDPLSINGDPFLCALCFRVSPIFSSRSLPLVQQYTIRIPDIQRSINQLNHHIRLADQLLDELMLLNASFNRNVATDSAHITHINNTVQQMHEAVMQENINIEHINQLHNLLNHSVAQLCPYIFAQMKAQIVNDIAAIFGYLKEQERSVAIVIIQSRDTANRIELGRQMFQTRLDQLLPGTEQYAYNIPTLDQLHIAISRQYGTTIIQNMIM
ncbi:MAG: hypothetical protein EXX96DRAFT_652544, partial [Benjaminiella poitrasii]